MKNAVLVIFIFTFTKTIWARNLEAINREYHQVEEHDFVRNSMQCYVTNRSSGINLAPVSIFNNNEFIQNLKINGNQAQIRVKLLENNNMLLQYWQTGHELYSETKTRPAFNFDQDMLGLSEIAQRDPDFAHLNSLACFVGPSIFYYEHNLPGNFLMATHVESVFFEESTARWWNRYLRQFGNWTKIVTKHIQHWRDFGLSNETLNHPENHFPDLLTGDLDMDVYKVSPGGFLHFKFGPEFDGKIVIVGGMFNNCFINNLSSITRALVDSERQEITVEFPIFYVYAQALGIFPNFNVEHDPLVYQLSDLYYNNPREVNRLLRNMETYLEFTSFYQIEVVVPGEEGLTLKPKLHLSLKTN